MSSGSQALKRARESGEALADVFSIPDLRRLQFAYLASLVSLWSFSVGSSVYAFQVGGIGLVGVLTVVRLLPAAIASPFAGVIADRYSRRRILVLTDLTRTVLTAAAAASIWVGLPPVTVFVLTGVLIVVSTIFEPAKNALLPELTNEPGQLAAANAVTNTFGGASIFVGPALGGGLLVAMSIPASFLVTAGLLVVSTLLLLRLGPGEPVVPPGDARKGVVAELGAGIRTVIEDFRLRLLMGLIGAQTFVSGLLGVLIVAMALDLLDLGDGGVGLLNAAVGLGAVVGGVLALSLVGAKRLSSAYAAGLLLWGVPIALIAAFTDPLAALVLLALVGIGDALVEVAGTTMLQRAVPDHVLARVFGLLEGLIWGSIGLGGALAPLLIELFGLRGAIVATGAVLPLVVVIVWARLQRLDLESPAPLGELELLGAVPFLTPLGGATLETLASEARRVSFSAGEEVTRQGETGDEFYVIVSGRVEVFENEVRVREEGPGEFFGEIALLRDCPRTATVRALSELELLALSHEVFVPAVTGHAESAREAESVIASRMGSARRSLATL